ncbi:MAG: hypothetical protein ACXAD7_01680 [Candidatus Kariarchaeaceae archaeon]|jgi:hypothetical protein
MLSDIKQALISQLGAALNMIETGVRNCPEDVWNIEIRGHKVWRVLYHALFYVDFYGNSLDSSIDNPEEQFTLPSIFNNIKVPSAHFEEPTDTILNQEIMLKYIDFLREKSNKLINDCTEVQFKEKARFHWHTINNLEMVMYFTRHVMQHIGHVSADIRERYDVSVPWSGKWP